MLLGTILSVSIGAMVIIILVGNPISLMSIAATAGGMERSGTDI